MTLAEMTGVSVSWDLNTATLLAIGAQIVLVVVYLVKTNGKASAAYSLAKEAKADAKEAQIQAAAVMGNLSLLRETVAREHPNQDDLTNMENRLTVEIHRISDRLDEIFDKRSSHAK